MEIIQTTRFKRDIKRLQKQGRDLAVLQSIIKILIKKKLLDPKFKDHKLVGNWKGHRDCHIDPDWLLVYKVEDTELHLIRTGSHAELFD
ncbi:type II toxin-antitoxin system YafQ family toxin [bacterium AH-315-C08]|nr:type II toxin-antitoxin system YafQ family toxin [bacterium AH-315-C08]